MFGMQPIELFNYLNKTGLSSSCIPSPWRAIAILKLTLGLQLIEQIIHSVRFVNPARYGTEGRHKLRAC
jgi:hypothetical protein